MLPTPSSARPRPVLPSSIIAIAWLVIFAVGTVGAETPPDVTISLTAEVRDTDSWLGFHEEITRTPVEAEKPLIISLHAQTGGHRSIAVGSPSFTAEINTYMGAAPVRLTVSGKIAGVNAVRALGPFQQAALEIQSKVVENEVFLFYGVFAVKARLLEVKVSTP